MLNLFLTVKALAFSADPHVKNDSAATGYAIIFGRVPASLHHLFNFLRLLNLLHFPYFPLAGSAFRLYLLSRARRCAAWRRASAGRCLHFAPRNAPKRGGYRLPSSRKSPTTGPSFFLRINRDAVLNVLQNIIDAIFPFHHIGLYLYICFWTP